MEASKSSKPAGIDVMRLADDLTQRLSQEADLQGRFKAHPLQVMDEAGFPVRSLAPAMRRDLEAAMRKVDFFVSAKCISCEIGFNALLAGLGGGAALLAAALAPEGLAATALVATLAGATTLSVAAITGIITVVAATAGGSVATALELAVSAICKAVKACN